MLREKVESGFRMVQSEDVGPGYASRLSGRQSLRASIDSEVKCVH